MDYAAIATRAKKKLTEAGTTMVLTRRSGGTFSPVAGEFTGAVETSYPAIGIFQAPNLMGRGERWIAGTEVKTGDKFILLAADGLDIVPQPGDLIDGYAIVNVMPITPGGVDLLYRILARK